MTPESSPFSQYVERPPNGRRLVVPDVHGCANTLTTLLDRLALTPQDQLFLLGDYIDRGPDSGGVLDKLRQLAEGGFQVYPLRGNHEQYLLDASSYYGADEFRRYVTANNAADVIDENARIYPHYRQFIENLPYFYELDNFYLVHAGFNFGSPAPFRDYRAMIETRDFRATPHQTNRKRVVHGHQVTSRRDIEDSLRRATVVIPLDNGCCFSRTPNGLIRAGNLVVGNLCCLELDTLTLTLQPNVE